MKWLQQVTQGQQQVDNLWEAFKARFLLNFTDIAATQKAQNKLQTLIMDSKKGVDSYIVKFEELAEEAGFDLENPSILYYFWKGLPANLLLRCLESNCYGSRDTRWLARPPQASSTDEDAESGPYGHAAIAIQ
jgi:Retrotransposon gag protein